MSGLLPLLLLAAPPSPPEVVKAEPLPDWNAKFRPTDGWVGGDGAYSVPLSETRTLWFFGDTWIGSVRDGKRVGVKMVNNTVGIQQRDGADAKLTFPIRRSSDKPLSQFVPPEGDGWFWPLAATAHDGTLFVFLAEVRKGKGGGAFGFKLVGQWLGVIDNPGDDPAMWKAKYTKLPFCEFTDTRTLTFGAATLIADGFAYIYGIDEQARKGLGAKRLVVARTPVGKLADLDAWRCLRGGKWLPIAEAAVDPDHLAGGVASECSVSYLPGLKRYALVYTENGIGERIVGRFAESPEGPWSEPILLYRCPKPKKDAKAFSYAAKAHPHLAGDNELVISYCVNSFELGPIINDATLYWPTFVRVTLK